MKKFCAYCDGDGALTKDHVWPECFLERTGREAAHFSHQTGRAHGADYVVRDVCAKCNNVILSQLDEYFCKMYDEYFVHTNGFDATVVFRYEYHLLVRTLLKIAYNSARSAGSDDSYLRPLRSYILTGGPIPQQLSVFAEVVSPTVVNDESMATGTRIVLPSGFYRSAVAKALTPNGKRVRCRIIAVNSFYFHLIFPAQPLTEAEFEQSASEIGTLVKGLVRLKPSTNEVSLRSSPQDAITSVVPHIKQHGETYREFFDRQKQ